ncbi:hypothetical protein B0J17DRAFT_772342 [Rhizoctonia solani]|nr:hypothetical protein B0J17DRAFT_772342 [Rhizoctonia solani]
MGSVHLRLMEQLGWSHSYLAQAHNKLTTTVYRLPDEIIAAIFYAYIYDMHYHGKPLQLEDIIYPIYDRLYTLMGVCSDWRRIALSRHAFWSLVPVQGYWCRKSQTAAIDKILERSAGSDLYLAGTVSFGQDQRLPKSIALYGSSICCVNIAEFTTDSFRNTVLGILKHGSPGKITDFSVHFENRWSREQSYLLPPNSLGHKLFCDIASSLRVLQLGNLQLHWTTHNFTSLLKVQLRNTVFEDPLEIENFLLAIASSSKLRKLQLISVKVATSRSSTSLQQADRRPGLPISFPSLQKVYLEGVHHDYIQPFLRSIMPGSHQTILNLPEEFASLYSGGQDNEQEIDRLAQQLKGLKIDTLMLTSPSFSDFKLYFMLKATPTIKSLFVSNHTFNQRTFHTMVRPVESSDPEFPKIHTLYLSDCIILPYRVHQLISFKQVMTSHGIQELGIGGRIWIHPPGEHEHLIRFHDPEYDNYMDLIKEWFKANVPKFKVVKSLDDLRDNAFRKAIWRLW